MSDFDTTRSGVRKTQAALTPPASPGASPAAARKAVLLSAFALLGIAVYRENQGQKNQGSLYKRVWGVSVMSMMLAILADFAPAIAGPFALLTVLGSLTNGGDAAIQNLLGGIAKQSPSGYAQSSGAKLH